jgi:hypothetical protein
MVDVIRTIPNKNAPHFHERRFGCVTGQFSTHFLQDLKKLAVNPMPDWKFHKLN